MNYQEIIAELRQEITEAQAALRYFERKATDNYAGPAKAVSTPSAAAARQSRQIIASRPSLSSQSIPEMVLELLRQDTGRAWSVPQIIEGVKAREKSLRGALNRMVSEGRLVRATRGRYQLNVEEMPERSAA